MSDVLTRIQAKQQFEKLRLNRNQYYVGKLLLAGFSVKEAAREARLPPAEVRRLLKQIIRKIERTPRER